LGLFVSMGGAGLLLSLAGFLVLAFLVAEDVALLVLLPVAVSLPLFLRTVGVLKAWWLFFLL